MSRASEPVRAQKRETDIHEKARRQGKPKDQVEHGPPSHPFDGANAKGKDEEASEAKREVDKVKHERSPSGQSWVSDAALRKGAIRD